MPKVGHVGSLPLQLGIFGFCLLALARRLGRLRNSELEDGSVNTGAVGCLAVLYTICRRNDRRKSRRECGQEEGCPTLRSSCGLRTVYPSIGR